MFFLVFAWTHHNLGPTFDAFALRSPIAIVVTELVTIRLFYWHFGHTQVAFTPFVQIAGVGGAMLVSFVMFWVAEALVRVLVFREWRPAFLLPAVAFAISLGYGELMMSLLARPGARSRRSCSCRAHRRLPRSATSSRSGKTSTGIYEMSKESTRKGELIVWPEGAIPAYIPADLGSVHQDPSLPWLGDGSAFLVGGYGVDAEQKRYNTAFAVYPDGTVPAPYFKRILIPFGEYMPFSSVFPWLNSLNENAGLFSSGQEIKVFAYPMERPHEPAYTAESRLSSVMKTPSPARLATRRGKGPSCW